MYKSLCIILFISASLFSQEKGILGNYNFRSPAFVYELDMGLTEISGLAVNDQGKLFAHNDEMGGVFELDPKNGRIIKWFYLGPNKVFQDFESITIVGEEFYLVTSGGILYKFYEQPDGQYSRYEKIRIGLSSSFDIEGMCYDPVTNALLLASKEFAGRDYRNSRAVYSFDLKTRRLSEKPRFVIPLAELNKRFKIKNFSPSGMERDSKTGNYLILSSGVRGILELSPDGRILSFRELKKADHLQPEGITILKDGTLLIADEGRGKKGTLTGYKLK
jgi:uncharacterized protein YjiK